MNPCRLLAPISTFFEVVVVIRTISLKSKPITRRVCLSGDTICSQPAKGVPHTLHTFVEFPSQQEIQQNMINACGWRAGHAGTELARTSCTERSRDATQRAKATKSKGRPTFPMPILIRCLTSPSVSDGSKIALAWLLVSPLCTQRCG
jgi:hypothetical protein